VYQADKRDLERFSDSVVAQSVWFQIFYEATKNPPETMEQYNDPNFLKYPGPYNNNDRVGVFVRALVQVLFPKFAEAPMFQIKDYVKANWAPSTWKAWGYY